jgi:AsmA protein
VLAVKGHLAIDRINTQPYLAPGANNDTVTAAKAKAANPDAPLSLGGLKAVNADLSLQVGELLLPQIKLEQALIRASLENGVLKADMNKVNVYGGNGSATLTVDASGAVPSFKSTLDVKDIKVQPFLAQMMNVKNITGKGAVHYDLASHGTAEKEIVKDLAGKGEVRFTDGEIEGADLAAISRVVQSVVTLDALSDVVGNSSKTQFGRMGASFVIDKGVLHTNDFALVNPVVEMSGQGNVDFSAETLEFHFVPKAVKGLPGLKLVDIGVPFYVKGPWSKPSYGPDARAFAKSIAEKLENGATSPLDLLKNPGLSLRSIFGTEKATSK